jgi:IS30 family transposase
MRNNSKSLTNDECASIREMLHNGESHNSIAKKVGRAQSTISAIAQREGINPVNRTPQSAIDRRREFALQERLEAADELLAKVLEVARSASTGREVKECAVAFGVLVVITMTLCSCAQTTV